MLEAIEIENYKSIEQLKLELGRVNIFIGENGCGKSNILEAIALAGAAEADKLDNEFLASRGIRVTAPELMRSRFSSSNQASNVEISIKDSDSKLPYYFSISNENSPYSKWTSENLLRVDIDDELISLAEKKPEGFTYDLDKFFSKYIYANGTDGQSSAAELLEKVITNLREKGAFVDFVIYSPENTALRNFYKEGQIEPLGINGEGLLKLIRVLNEEEPEKLAVIKEALQLFDWYDDFKVPTEHDQMEGTIHILDRYLNGAVFDQRSANEGFLFILFYMALIVSKDTPSIFAIDNIDASLNPKLCTRLVKDIARLSKQYDKQVLLTTHNPATLDGLDLNDPEQRLFVVSRNRKGATRVKRITADKKPVSASGEDLKLSEAMLRGYIGGLPKGF